MMRKISITTILITILFSGIFISSAAASASEDGQQHSHKSFYSINKVEEHLSGNEFWQYFLNQFEQPVQEQNEQHQEEQPAPQEETVTEQEEQQSDSNGDGELSQFEQEVVELTNAERSKHGLQPLQMDAELSNVAREKSRDMAASNYFDHNSPTYGSPFDMIQQFGIQYRSAGENIAKGQRSPQEVVNAWMNSEGHRANILNDNFTHIGVGFVEQGNHWTQMFIGK
jgi:uncharacterized YkwD family protein